MPKAALNGVGRRKLIGQVFCQKPQWRAYEKRRPQLRSADGDLPIRCHLKLDEFSGSEFIQIFQLFAHLPFEGRRHFRVWSLPRPSQNGPCHLGAGERKQYGPAFFTEIVQRESEEVELVVKCASSMHMVVGCDGLWILAFAVNSAESQLSKRTVRPKSP